MGVELLFTPTFNEEGSCVPTLLLSVTEVVVVVVADDGDGIDDCIMPLSLMLVLVSFWFVFIFVAFFIFVATCPFSIVDILNKKL